jgi:hypothetical protein
MLDSYFSSAWSRRPGELNCLKTTTFAVRETKKEKMPGEAQTHRRMACPLFANDKRGDTAIDLGISGAEAEQPRPKPEFTGWFLGKSAPFLP